MSAPRIALIEQRDLPPRAAYTIPPELRRLRAAWGLAINTRPDVRAIATTCATQPVETLQGPRSWTLTAQSITGGGICITINDRDEIVVVTYEDTPFRLAIPLPPHLRGL